MICSSLNRLFRIPFSCLGAENSHCRPTGFRGSGQANHVAPPPATPRQRATLPTIRRSSTRSLGALPGNTASMSYPPEGFAKGASHALDERDAQFADFRARKNS